MAEQLRQLVRERADERCEYCRFPEACADFPFQIDHVIALKHEGPTASENLAYACYYCNTYKGPNLSGIDPQTRQIVPLFHPRNDSWSEHFEVAVPGECHEDVRDGQQDDGQHAGALKGQEREASAEKNIAPLVRRQDRRGGLPGRHGNRENSKPPKPRTPDN